MSPRARSDRAAPSSMGPSARVSRLRGGPSGRVVPGADGVDDVLHAAVLDRVVADEAAGRDRTDRVVVRRAVARALAAEGVVLAPAHWAALVRDLVDEIAGLGPLDRLLRDPAVTDVCCNGPHEVWVDRHGRLERTAVSFRDDGAMLATIRRALAPTARRLDRGHPCVDATLPGGIRLHAAIPPVVAGPVLTLRRVASVVPTWEDLAASGSVPAELREVLVELVAARRNLVVAGRAGSGKTTLLARLLAEVGDDRVVVLEDTPELGHPSRHAVALGVVEPAPDGGGGVSLADLVRHALRMRPDRLVVGEVRGPEVASLLQAMNTGHDGTMTTVHANSPGDALVRLEGMALQAGLPLAAARAQVDAAVDVVVSLVRDGRRRRVDRVVAVTTNDGVRVLDERWRA
ncbi:CpaF family protein [Salsipaludibacter albus]|uniref:CpaF family protein n=1 Tax=Salsipaludibacter albus TaxID=2849650 RepID=UPI001EE42870|nr:ATPase, T2SS/T4P/T4SS family [Salsipaludibacter albus]MBY5161788.1 Flp pilus assembly complex ATPase component TadA [Salsipaludibacter albus]